jgi:hypothetical protein
MMNRTENSEQTLVNNIGIGVIQFSSNLIYLHANSTAQGPITKLA